MDTVVQIVVLIMAISAFCFSLWLLKHSPRARNPISALTFVFLLVIVLTVSKYKIVRGPGFEAETWDQKQVQAAVLIDRLQSLTESSSQQVALLASKLGFWDAGLSIPQLADLLKQTGELLNAAEVPSSRQETILQPIRKRIFQNYGSAAFLLVRNALGADERRLTPARNVANQTANLEERELLDKKIGLHNRDKEAFGRFAGVATSKQPITVEAVRAFVKGTDSLGQNERLMGDLDELAADVAFFQANGKLRPGRDIDFSYLNDVAP